MTGRFRTDWFSRLAELHGPSPAVVDDATGTVWTYADLDRVGGLTAAWLKQQGVLPGQRIAVVGENSMAHILLLIGCQKSGAVLVPLNYRLAVPELDYLLGHCQASLLVYGDEVASSLEGIATDIPRERIPSVEEVLARASWPAAAPDPDPLPEDHPLMILYTSGTTGRPKGAIISHGMVFWNAVNTLLRLGLTPGDRSVNGAPFHHTGGWNVLLTPFFLAGARTYLTRRFDPSRIVELCRTERLTILWGVPTMMRLIADVPDFGRDALESVRFALVGGEAMPEPLIRTWQDVGVPIRQGFGMTEVGVNCFSLPEEDALRKIGSIGTPNFFLDARVVDGIGRHVGPEEVGELHLRGPVVTPGYWADHTATRAAIRNGWFQTGDLVRVDHEGYFYVVGRKKDMYISGGENVYPAEVEAVLAEHPAVAEAAVIGVPDERWGESGVAIVVVRKPGLVSETELIDFCRRHLARFKCPGQVRFVQALPRGASGKVSKTHLTDYL